MDKSVPKIEKMFDDIALRYDFLNHFFTLNLDKLWRRKIISFIRRKNIPAVICLDLASGTGDMAKELLRLNPEVVYSVDISGKMLEIQRKKISDTKLRIVQSDSENLPVKSDSLDILTIAFGIRNFENIEKSLTEIKRSLKPGGMLVILEMFSGKGLKNRLFSKYFGKVIPYLGNKISKSKFAYEYLSHSVNSFYTPEEFIYILENAGFKHYNSRNNFINVVNTIYFTK